MRDYERFEPVRPAPPTRNVTLSRGATELHSVTKRPVRVNRAAIALGDPVMIFGALLRVFARRKR